MILKKIFLFIPIFLFFGCGDVTTTSSTTIPSGTTTPSGSSMNVTLSGSVTYDSVPFKNATSGALDYDNITQKPVRGALVEIVDASGTVLATTSTDEGGNYATQVNASTVKVRVSAKLYKAPRTGESSWNFEVKDNTNGNALYAMEGNLASVGTNGVQTRNLHAPSGWGGTSYSATRVAAPFSVLDVTYQSMQKVLSSDPKAVFPPLNIFWSKDNRTGNIGTSHYDSGEVALYLLGHEDSDTEEYDVGIVAHEWTHYYEHAFSRTDTIGGSHASGDILDMRLAFGEGFATAVAGLIIETPLYRDSGDDGQQGTMFVENLENGGSNTNPGWFSEASIYHIIYDIYDTEDDVGDTLSFPFSSLHSLATTTLKNTVAYTSIFPFITGLKEQNPTRVAEINALTSNESIADITDIYGTGRTNRRINANPLYADLQVGGSIRITPNYSAYSWDSTRALGVSNFVKFTIPRAGIYTINVSSTSGVDLDFYAHKEGERDIAITSSGSGTSISGTATLSAGEYRMDIRDSETISNKTFIVTLNEI